jgi:hypothetical protein
MLTTRTTLAKRHNRKLRDKFRDCVRETIMVTKPLILKKVYARGVDEDLLLVLYFTAFARYYASTGKKTSTLKLNRFVKLVKSNDWIQLLKDHLH